jgi:signal transduction histidine kinase
MVTHDARNMVSALELYCDLLEEPGVLTASFRRYAGELRHVARASRRLVEDLATLKTVTAESTPGPAPNPMNAPRNGLIGGPVNGPMLLPVSRPFPTVVSSSPHDLRQRARLHPQLPIHSFADELQSNRNLLAALAGPGITLGMTVSGGDCPVAMSGDDLTRVLVNLVKNASEAMPSGGHIQIALERKKAQLLLTVTDNGPGIPQAMLERIFTSGYSTHIDMAAEEDEWLAPHRGLGLPIVRSLANAAGGRAWAANRDRAAEANHAPWQADPEAWLRSRGDPETRFSGAIFSLEIPILQ